MVARLAADHPEPNVLLMDSHHVTFPDASFDVVVAASVLGLVDDPAVVVAEVRRVLSPVAGWHHRTGAGRAPMTEVERTAKDDFRDEVLMHLPLE